MKKLCIVFKQAYGMKLKFKFWFSSLQPWKLYTILADQVGCNTAVNISLYIQPMQKQMQKTNVATKTLRIIPITGIFHISNGSKHRTQKKRVLWS